MQPHFLPNFVAISMTKSQFCFATGCTPYRLRRLLTDNAEKYRALGLNKWDKLLMPNVVRQLLADTNLQINLDFYTQYVAGQRAARKPRA